MPREKEKIGCGNCIYYDAEDNECHRCPPQIVEQSGRLNGRFPEILAYEWCGEWKSAQKEEDVK